MKHTIAFSLVAIFMVAGLVGAAQVYLDNPVRGCVQFETNTEYKGYDCGDNKKYIKS